MSLKEPVAECKLFRSLYKQLKVIQQHPRSQLIDAINYLDQNCYTLRRVELERGASLLSSVEREISTLMPPQDHNIGLCRAVRYYSSWIESEMVAESQEPTEPTEAKKEGKPSILAFIGKEKRKQKNMASSIRLLSKESKRETMYLYFQFELMEPIKVPREEDRLNFVCLVYWLAKQMMASGVVPDLAFSSVVRDGDKKVKFLKKSDKGTDHFSKQLLTLFLHIMTGTDKAQQQLKNIVEVAEIPVLLREALASKNGQFEGIDMLTNFLQRHIEEEVSVALSDNGKDNPMLLSLKESRLTLSQPSDHFEQYELDLKECMIEYRRQPKTSFVMIKHSILEPLLLKTYKNSFCVRLFRELSQDN